MQTRAPQVSVIMAFHNAGPYFADAIASVLAQSHENFELILADDGSTDGSRARAEGAAEADPRVRVVSGPQGGPAVARNRALDVARGAFVGVVDADDLLHPARLERLVGQAEALGVDMVADDLVHFGAETGRSLLQPLDLSEPWRVSAEDLLAAETRQPPVALGYLKPLIRRTAIGESRYRAELRIGEDFDFLIRLSLSGARLAVLPEAYYLYRRHQRSISHRLAEPAARAMIAALDDLAAEPAAKGLEALIAERRAGLVAAADFAALVEQLKSGRWPAALSRLASQPSLIRPLLRAWAEGRSRVATPVDRPGELTLAEAPDAGHGQAVAVPAQNWRLSDVLTLVAASNSGQADIRAVGRPGLEALGYVPGWRSARLIAPPEGWSAAETRLISALPWPVVEGCA